LTWQVEDMYHDPYCGLAEKGIEVGDVYSATITYQQPLIPEPPGVWTGWDFGAEYPAYGELGDLTWTKLAYPRIRVRVADDNGQEPPYYDLFEVLGYPGPLPGTRDVLFFFQLYDGTATMIEEGVPVGELNLNEWERNHILVDWWDNYYHQDCQVRGSILTLSTSFVPAEDWLLDLIAQVEALNLDNGITNSLDAKLQNAVKALDDINDNNDAAAIGKLEAFINEVEAQSGNKIPADDAAKLIATAQAIIDLLTI
jgi:hypothetical protein